MSLKGQKRNQEDDRMVNGKIVRKTFALPGYFVENNNYEDGVYK